MKEKKNKNLIILQKKGRKAWKTIRQNWLLYVFVLPAFLYVILFCYWPMYGLQIAFRNYSFSGGIVGSPWVGLKWIERFIESPRFWQIIKNTLTLSIYSLVAGFFPPIILALILNNVKNARWKKFAQTVTYLPHFISTVVVVSMLCLFFSPSSGFINTILSWFGGSGHTHFMGKPEYFKHMYVWSGIWQSMGWGSIIYLAALSGVDPALHEAARMDGANKWQRVIHIDIPSILPTIIILLIMDCGRILSVGYEKVILLYNPGIYETADIISSYVYRNGLALANYSRSAAVDLFNSVINIILLVTANTISKKINDVALW